MNRIFVYGTLKSDHFRHSSYLDGAQSIGPATIEGFTLYSVNGRFPAAIRTEGKQVKGEVYDVDDATVRRLDYLESNGDMYNREQVQTEHGLAWVYVMTKEFHDECDGGDGLSPAIGESWEHSHYVR